MMPFPQEPVPACGWVAMTIRRRGLLRGTVSPDVPAPTDSQRTDGLAAASAALAAARIVSIVCHENPDADTLGGGLALADALEQGGATVEVVCSTTWPSTLRFLPGVERVRHEPSLEPDAIVLVDCASVERAGAGIAAWIRAASASELISLDHHRSNVGFGTIDCIQPGAAASSEIVAALISSLGATPSRAGAVNLLAGILHDTDGLRSPETSPQTLRLVADLVEAGESVGVVSHELFGRRTASAMRLWGEVARSIELADGGRVAIGIVRREMLAASGAEMLDAEGLPEMLVTIDGVEVALLLREVEGGTRVSIRTSGIPIAAEIAARFGGGGHDGAAGCTLPLKVEATRTRLLDELDALDWPSRDVSSRIRDPRP